VALADGNPFLLSILRSLPAGVAVLGSDMSVRAWNREAERLWRLRDEEVQGEHFLNLDIGLPVDLLRGPIRSCLSGDSPQERLRAMAVNRRGREITCAVTVSPLLGEGSITGVIVMMEEIDQGGDSRA
jgi:two-component system CheB/CheR fusion protein